MLLCTVLCSSSSMQRAQPRRCIISKAENKKRKRKENRLVSGSPLQSDDNQAREKQYTHAYILNRVTFIMYFFYNRRIKKR
jgi:hypothetical protein